MPAVEPELLPLLEEWLVFEAEPEVFRLEPSEYARRGAECSLQSSSLLAARFGLAACSVPEARRP